MERGSGVLLHISSLPGDYGEGSFGVEAKEFVDFLHECGFSYWQVLPFCMPDAFHSPYKSFSAFSGNFNFIDLPSLRAQGLITEEELRAQRQRIPYACEFDRLSETRLSLLRQAARRAWDDLSLRREIESFTAENPHIDLFCRFMAKKEANGHRPWNEWTVPGQTDLREEEKAAYFAYSFTQYIFFTQWMEIKRYANSRKIDVIGDIPFYVDYDSADVWASPSSFQLDEKGKPTAVAGVPPDYFSEDGQMWGNPLYDWDKMKETGFLFWRERMRHMLTLFDGVRIDHFRGLESYFRIPSDAKNARAGKWVKGPGKELIDCLKPMLREKLIIAEDLGEITDAVRELVEYSGFPGMRVLQFAFLGDENSPHLPHNYGQNTAAYTGTHDNTTLLGYVWSLDSRTRARLFRYCGYEGNDLDRCYDSILRTLFASHAGLLILPIQDLLLYGEDTRMNRPGTENGNWSYRVTREQLAGIDREKFRQWNRLYGRCR